MPKLVKLPTPEGNCCLVNPDRILYVEETLYSQKKVQATKIVFKSNDWIVSSLTLDALLKELA